MSSKSPKWSSRLFERDESCSCHRQRQPAEAQGDDDQIPDDNNQCSLPDDKRYTAGIHYKAGLKISRSSSSVLIDTTLTWQERLFIPATVTSMESKYSVVSHIAEFWCTLTSPFFALPLLIYLHVPFNDIPNLQHACIAGACLSALVSLLYHWTLYRLWSTADAAIATITFYLNVISLNRHSPNPHPLWLSELTWVATFVSIAVLFVLNWEKTHRISVHLILVCLPLALFGFWSIESYIGMVSGITGLLCFILDRKGIVGTHAIWHILGGISLLWGIWDATLVAIEK
ncbi:uncharacterized protein BJ171DRAFT_490707 [Polychytrium aggregatum]|uniref:uncharacterized protein n=1 Tax=Polychytrium aggregatum TaxID=110093 RepID=UPI0022FF3E36|nr:uncharacterized protein BJ171DRAFT_490707 [Polychytrium aggregatum]KAI9208227.1 hypothetical protein BJ171DRAFT_490707 [Polychytrium aggregatum]